MSTWTSGYVADIGYTYGYYNELNPLRIKLAMLSKGLSFPECVTACELGFGQGLSASVHAAASNIQWYGTDFNPSQAANAKELVAAAESAAKLYDESFEEFATRVDLPDFDFIGIHGIWSWISDSNRALLVDFIRRKLKVGGVVYISYNTLPGWAAFAPMRHLMTLHADIIGSAGNGIVSRIDNALEFAEKLVSANALYARANPQVAERLKSVKSQDRHYLAHEYFNKDWHPMHFATMAEWLESAKVSFAGSAHYLEHVDPINLTTDQQKLLTEISDNKFRESTRDFLVNQQFRRDYWVKGPRLLTPLEQAESIRQVKLVLISPKNAIKMKVSGSLGEADMSEKIYAPLIDLMSDHEVRSFGDIEKLISNNAITFPQLFQAVLILCGQGNMAPAQDDAVIASAKVKADKLNKHLFHKARSSSDVGYLACPVTGGGIPVARFNQLFLSAYVQGSNTPEACAKYVWELLSAQNQRIIKDGKAVESPEENLKELTAQASEFLSTRLELMKKLQVI